KYEITKYKNKKGKIKKENKVSHIQMIHFISAYYKRKSEHDIDLMKCTQIFNQTYLLKLRVILPANISMCDCLQESQQRYNLRSFLLSILRLLYLAGRNQLPLFQLYRRMFHLNL